MTVEAMNPEDLALVEVLVAYYAANISWCYRFLNSVEDLITNAAELQTLIHSTRKRVKDEDSLRNKLIRKWEQYKAKAISKENLFELVNDLAGFRIMHLHTDQVESIHKNLLALFEGANYELVEDPQANVWDDEFENHFQKIGIKTSVNPRMYMSVHYVIASPSKIRVTCEIQVRTLADELWGEVDHRINYPTECPSETCRDQIRVLARVASSCSRLVDSIMRSYERWKEREQSKA